MVYCYKVTEFELQFKIANSNLDFTTRLDYEFNLFKH